MDTDPVQFLSVLSVIFDRLLMVPWKWRKRKMHCGRQAYGVPLNALTIYCNIQQFPVWWLMLWVRLIMTPHTVKPAPNNNSPRQPPNPHTCTHTCAHVHTHSCDQININLTSTIHSLLAM